MSAFALKDRRWSCVALVVLSVLRCSPDKKAATDVIDARRCGGGTTELDVRAMELIEVSLLSNDRRSNVQELLISDSPGEPESSRETLSGLDGDTAGQGAECIDADFSERAGPDLAVDAAVEQLGWDQKEDDGGVQPGDVNLDHSGSDQVDDAWEVQPDDGQNSLGDSAEPDGQFDALDDAPSSSGVCPEGFPVQITSSNKIVLEATINDTGPYKFLYDSGAPGDLIDSDLLDVLGDGPLTFTIAGKTVEASYIYPYPYWESDTMSGILGNGLLSSFVVTFDIQRQRFWLEDVLDELALLACEHVTGQPIFAPIVESTYLFVMGKLENIEGPFLMDTGSHLNVVQDIALVALQAAAPRPAIQGVVTCLMFGCFWGQAATVGSFSVGGLQVQNMLVRSVPDEEFSDYADWSELPLLGFLAMPYLKRFLFSIDYPNATLRLDRFADDSGVELPSWFPVGIGIGEVDSHPVHVVQVMEGSSAEEGGVLPGDEVIAAGGVAYSDIPMIKWNSLLTSGTEGEIVQVSVIRDGVPMEFDLEAQDLLKPPEK